MKNLNFSSLVVFLGAAMLLSACGSQTARVASGSSASSVGSGSGSGGFGTGSGSGGGNIYNLPAAPSQNIKVSGGSGPSPVVAYSVATSRTLKIKVTALNAPNLTIPGYTNWVFPYGCMQITVTVNGQSQTTQVLKVANLAQPSSQCQNAQSSQVLDFTNAMTGNSAVTISVSNPQYDNCRQYYPLNYGCYMSAVWSNHLVAATLQTQVDGTWMDP